MHFVGWVKRFGGRKALKRKKKSETGIACLLVSWLWDPDSIPNPVWWRTEAPIGSMWKWGAFSLVSSTATELPSRNDHNAYLQNLESLWFRNGAWEWLSVYTPLKTTGSTKGKLDLERSFGFTWTFKWLTKLQRQEQFNTRCARHTWDHSPNAHSDIHTYTHGTTHTHISPGTRSET